jgi:hypothetical protein
MEFDQNRILWRALILVVLNFGCYYQIHIILVDSTEFRRLCITHRIIEFLDSFHCPVF